MDEHAAWIGGYMLARGMKTIQARDIYRAYRQRWHIDPQRYQASTPSLPR
jgi:DNA-binding IscR family transcriptional regulator